ncbi:hypothetical protein [Picosynechococcus sp. PCC 73109]|uniref:hypothetical protein n=1 Tax=Picosynechococcus sp. PCC 73109 TaxID=374982 RepID=UPI0007458A01|nr:hypothetical protein [Picosynechococcus sp. PCC 73109]AMA10667.1 hypothetical protein AWQ23_14560 [Picosynechococcus sp. PCC 73109]
MGQEYGHAYEDLLDLALLEILPDLSRDKLELRISPLKQIKGVSGNIDHLIEFWNENSLEWEPYLLFLEKYSDSEAHSRPAFRRHLEEYIQAKVSSVINFGYSLEEPMLIINLLYGTSTGWRKIILKESKRLMEPTLFLVEFDWYESIESLVHDSVMETHPKYERHKIREIIKYKTGKNKAFKYFKKIIYDYINLAVNNQAQNTNKKFIINEINRSKYLQVDSIELKRLNYIRRNLTEILVLPAQVRRKVINLLISGKKSFYLEKDLTYEELRVVELCFVGSTLVKDLKGYRLDISTIMSALPRDIDLIGIVEFLEKFFFENYDFYKIRILSYFGYFDILNLELIDINLNACNVIRLLLQDDVVPLSKFLMGENTSLAILKSGTEDDVFQNIYLEFIMSLTSWLVREVLKIKKKDLSSPRLAELSGISRFKLNQSRHKVIDNLDTAESIANGVKRFYFEELGKDNGILHNAVEHLQEEIKKLEEYKKFYVLKRGGEIPVLPNMFNPEVSMSLVWNRHNQLNSHHIFNPLFALIYRSVTRILGDSVDYYGFPYESNANPLKIVFGDDYDGAEYKFSLVCWNLKNRDLFIYESSSVINFKHSSDKCKELCARIRIVRSLLFGYCNSKFYLVVDGDWKKKHLNDLKIAGWDEVIYSRDFLEKDFNN